MCRVQFILLLIHEKTSYMVRTICENSGNKKIYGQDSWLNKKMDSYMLCREILAYLFSLRVHLVRGVEKWKDGKVVGGWKSVRIENI